METYNIYSEEGHLTAARAGYAGDHMAQSLGFKLEGTVSVPVGGMFPGSHVEWEQYLESQAVALFVEAL